MPYKKPTLNRCARDSSTGFVRHIFYSTWMLSIYTPSNIKSPLAREIWKLAGHLGLFFGYILICCAFYCTYEGWPISDTIMFSLATMSTIGYGYNEPSDDNSRLFTIFSMIIGVFLIFGSLNDAVVTRIKNMTKSDNLLFAEMTTEQIYRYHQRSLALTILFIVVFLFISAGIFAYMESWTFVEALYFSVQTATTIGYGDMQLQGHDGTNWVLGFYIMLSTTLLVFAFNNFRTLHEDFRKIKATAKFAERKQTLDKLKELDKGQGVPMDKFILAVLVQLGKLDQANDIEPWIKKFREMDRNSTGIINSQEIEQFSRNEAEVAEDELTSLRQITTGTNNVAWASLNDMTANVAGVLNLGTTAGQDGNTDGVLPRRSDGVQDRVSARGYTSENTLLRDSNETHNEVLKHARNDSM